MDELQKKLTDPRITWREKDKILKMMRLNNFYGEINLLCYCLMPNHFHLLIKQKSSNAIDRFMNSLNTKYVMYFNKKYSRVGPLFEGVYKAVLVKTTEQLMYLSAYIHGNPSVKSNSISPISQGEALNKLLFQPSSLPEYLGLKTTNWVETSLILNLFPRQKGSYEKFVLNNLKPHKLIRSLILEN
ncbi:MAG: transposase [Candidatus Jordarchaeaceae archaeon]